MGDDTILAGLLAEAQELRSRPVVLQVPGRTLVLHCTAPTDGEALKRQERSARARHKDTYEIHFSRAVVATYCDWIESDGEPLVLGGERVCFKDQLLQDALDAATASDAVKALIVSDGVIGMLAGQLAEAFIGSSDDDPT
ncbi:MAG: hypothetical protein R2686_07130 [Candidatus Nanopelagicales bacterium]